MLHPGQLGRLPCPLDSMGDFHAPCGQCGRLPPGDCKETFPPWTAWETSTPPRTGLKTPTLPMDIVGGFHNPCEQHGRLPCPSGQNGRLPCPRGLQGNFHTPHGQPRRLPHPPGQPGRLLCPPGQCGRLPCSPWTAWEPSMPPLASGGNFQLLT